MCTHRRYFFLAFALGFTAFPSFLFSFSFFLHPMSWRKKQEKENKEGLHATALLKEPGSISPLGRAHWERRQGGHGLHLALQPMVFPKLQGFGPLPSPRRCRRKYTSCCPYGIYGSSPPTFFFSFSTPLLALRW